jgi:hypothetical protein
MKRLLLVLAGFVLWSAGTARAETVRRIEYGTFVRGLAVGGEQEDESYRREVFRLQGRAGDHVHAAVIAPTASAVLVELSRAGASSSLDHDRTITDKAGLGELWTTGSDQITNRFSGDFTLPDDGEYDITLSIMRDGLSADSPPIRYTFAVDREPVVRRLEYLVDHGGLGWKFHTQIAIKGGSLGFSTGSEILLGFGLSLGPGYQLGDKLGVDVLAATSVGVSLNSDTTMNRAPTVVLSTLLGPRLRYGNKYAGYSGISAGLTYMTVFTKPEGAEDPDSLGVGLKLEHVFAVAHNTDPDYDAGATVMLQGEWNGPLSIYSAGLAFSF